jgi:sigma-54 dependent transcriptional regulator of gfr operon
MTDNGELILKDKNDPFNKLIGSHGSLKEQVKMCKSAATYPPDGLPILLIGNTGIGKSFMAQLIYEYAKNNELINKDAPYIIFNCAEYANNPELLSANLFGFVKGAFTGADKDKSGLLEEANEGYLFLDEVHRLTPEGQEKLFLFLDKGIFRRFGETNNWRSSKVRFIFATTEDPELSLINSFLRRIPLVVNIPALSRRPIHEKLQMIYHFYQNEAKNIGIDILVSKQVIDGLLKADISGNIGKLINAIKYSCALAYDVSIIGNSKILRIHLHDLPDDIKVKIDFNLNGSILNNMFVSKNVQEDFASSEVSENEQIHKETEKLFKLIQDYKSKEIGIQDFKKAINMSLNKILDKIIFKNIENYNNTVFYNTTKKVIQNVLSIMENLYGIKYYGNAAIVFTYLLYIIQNDIIERLNVIYDLEDSINIIKSIFPKEFLIAKKMVELIEVNLDIKINRLIVIYFTLYIKTFNNERNMNNVTAIIISHGYSTASSISSVANKLLGQFVFEAFDMPIEMPTKEIMHKVCDYLKNIDTSSGIIILVDMGSLEEIYKSIVDYVNGDIGIVNNITTQLALEVGNRIKLGDPIEKMISESVLKNNNMYKFIKYDKDKKDGIIVTCMTGIGMAVKIRDLLTECLVNNDIEIIAYDYNKLKGNGIKDEIFKNYNVKLIIGTSSPDIMDTPYLSLEDLILGKGYSILEKALINIAEEKDVKKINQAIIKLFSLQNVIKYITILNSDKIIDQVEIIMNELEMSLGVCFANDLKISLYIHICCLMERLVMKEPIMTYKGLDEFKQCHEQFINYVIKSFSVIADVYKVEIPVSEIGYIYDIIHLKINDLN